MKIYREYNKTERFNQLQGKLQRLQNGEEKETDPEKRLFIRAQIENLKKQIRHIS